MCAPDDGWRYHQKNVEQFTDINSVTLHLVGCLLDVLTMHGSLNVKSVEFQFCVSVHHIMINKNTSLMQLISIYFTYSKSLHVSGRILPIIRRI